MGFCSKGLKNEFEIAVVSETSVFETLKIYWIFYFQWQKQNIAENRMVSFYSGDHSTRDDKHADVISCNIEGTQQISFSHFLEFYDNPTLGPGCSKLTTSLVNVSLYVQKLISQICHYFFIEKMWEAQKLLPFLKTKNSVYLVIKL